MTWPPRPARRARRRKLLADLPDLLEDGFLDLADPHAGQAVDLTDALERMRPVLGCNVDAVVTLTEVDPVRAAFTLAVYTSLGVDRKTCRAIDDTVARVTGLDDF